MSKYVIRNCPAFDEGDCASPAEHISQATACEHIEDCKLKQIVEKCKDAKTECECYDTHLLCLGEKIFAEKILNLLDIQEIE